MLSNEDTISEGLKWFKTKFGFSGDRDEVVRFPSEVARCSIVWSPVMHFIGSLDDVGALIFTYEGPAASFDGKPNVRSLLHEVVRQTCLQSRYTFPVLIVNFNDANSSNASDVEPLLT